MKAYKELVEKVLTEGTLKKNRTGIDSISVTGLSISHDLREGFPLLTTRKIFIRGILVELEAFIKGISSKKWLQERGCNFWNSWANPKKAPYGHDEESKKRMFEENDLGRYYGVQWNSWKGYNGEYHNQIKSIVETLKSDPYSRRMLCSSWNVGDFEEMSLLPCCFAYQVISDGTFLDLVWYQRSSDLARGNPTNLAHHSILLMLFAKEVNLIARKVTGFIGDAHVYVNQVEGLKKQLEYPTLKLPTVEIPNENWKGIFEWTYKDFILKDYIYNKDKIDLGEIAV